MAVYNLFQTRPYLLNDQCQNGLFRRKRKGHIQMLWILMWSNIPFLGKMTIKRMNQRFILFSLKYWRSGSSEIPWFRIRRHHSLAEELVVLVGTQDSNGCAWGHPQTTNAISSKVFDYFSNFMLECCPHMIISNHCDIQMGDNQSLPPSMRLRMSTARRCSIVETSSWNRIFISAPNEYQNWRWCLLSVQDPHQSSIA